MRTIRVYSFSNNDIEALKSGHRLVKNLPAKRKTRADVFIYIGYRDDIIGYAHMRRLDAESVIIEKPDFYTKPYPEIHLISDSRGLLYSDSLVLAPEPSKAFSECIATLPSGWYLGIDKRELIAYDPESLDSETLPSLILDYIAQYESAGLISHAIEWEDDYPAYCISGNLPLRGVS